MSGVRENVEIRNSKTKRVNETNPFFSETFHENEKKNNRFQSNELKIKLILRPVWFYDTSDHAKSDTVIFDLFVVIY